MNPHELLGIAVFLILFIVIIKPLGSYLAKIYQGERTFLSPESDQKERSVADWVFRNQQVASRETTTLGSSRHLYLPLKTSVGRLGVLGIEIAHEEDYTSPQFRLLLDTFAGQTATALELVRHTFQEEQTQGLTMRKNLERTFLNSISHDLRSPLASISEVLSNLKEQEPDSSKPAKQELLVTASKEASRLNLCIANLLIMTRLEAGILKLNEEPCNVQGMINCSLTQFNQQLTNRSVRTHVPPDIDMVVMDVSLMTQVMVNLLENAMKFSPPDSEINIRVRLDRTYLRIEVEDRGHGIPEGDEERVFDKFYLVQVPAGLGGTGLGLSVCRGIVEAHGGRIMAKNNPGRGFSIILKLPLKSFPETEVDQGQHR
jgi:two-component system, OmpR family, sensor histidine kinase KdpD